MERSVQGILNGEIGSLEASNCLPTSTLQGSAKNKFAVNTDKRFGVFQSALNSDIEVAIANHMLDL